jgi:hypothetical protein
MTTEPTIANVQVPEARVFKIPVGSMPTFTDKFAKFVKRAHKIGCEVPSYTVVGESHEVLQVVVGKEEDQFGRERDLVEERVSVFTHITIHNPLVVVAGYTFVATLEHTEEGNLLRKVPGVSESLPTKYRDCGPWCDHCKMNRRRRDTFVVRHEETGEYRQIGRNCLADYLGKDAERAALQAELACDVSELGEACEGESSYGCDGGSSYDMLDKFLAYVADVITHVGWISNTVAKQTDRLSTSSIAYTHMHPSKEDIRRGLLFRTPTAGSSETAKLAIGWASSISDDEVSDNDYLHNIRVIARRGIISYKQHGYAASIVSGYQRHMLDLKRKEYAITHPSEYVGVKGERSTFKVLVGKVITLDGAYGTTYMHLMQQVGTNNAIVWRSSGECLDTGKEYNVSGTVKDHSEYKGVKQTILTRCTTFDYKTFVCSVDGSVWEIVAEDDKDARKYLLTRLGKARMPKGATIELKQTVAGE